jgi:hypothetical protein
MNGRLCKKKLISALKVYHLRCNALFGHWRGHTLARSCQSFHVAEKWMRFVFLTEERAKSAIYDGPLLLRSTSFRHFSSECLRERVDTLSESAESAAIKARHVSLASLNSFRWINRNLRRGDAADTGGRTYADRGAKCRARWDIDNLFLVGLHPFAAPPSGPRRGSLGSRKGPR